MACVICGCAGAEHGEVCPMCGNRYAMMASLFLDKEELEGYAKQERLDLAKKVGLPDGYEAVGTPDCFRVVAAPDRKPE